ncbi:transposase [Streptomyces sp. TRM70308]|uniref:transposase n=1 Tax=Streptomyces sp. TRM70308 TaxID=3131932 RepID=UPI003CFE8198
MAHRLRRRPRHRWPARAAEGRTLADELAWPAATPPTWRHDIQHVAIGMSATHRAAVRTGLPHAGVVVGRFHVVQLASKGLLHGPAPHHRRGQGPATASLRRARVHLRTAQPRSPP